MNVTVGGIEAFLRYVSSELNARHGTHRQHYEIWFLFIVCSTDDHIARVLQVSMFVGCDTPQLNKSKSEWFEGSNTA
jgi:hypothetical protein